MGELTDLFRRYSQLIEEAFDIDDEGNLIEVDSSKVATTDLLFHDLFVSNVQGILTELVAPMARPDEDSSGHEYGSPMTDDDDEFSAWGRGWRGPYGNMTPMPATRRPAPPNSDVDQDNEFGRGRVNGPHTYPQAPAPNYSPHAGETAGMIPHSTAMAAMTGATFNQKAPGIMTNLMNDFGLTPQQAAGILGNLGHETGGFTSMQELKPQAGRGGLGWAQWTGPRRVEFENWAKQNNLDTNSDEANYGFLKHELQGKYASTLADVKRQNTVGDSMLAFERGFEGAGIKNYQSRNTYATQALNAYNQGQTPETDNGLAQYARGNATLGGPSSVARVNGEFGRRIQAMVADMPPDLQKRFSIESGFRDMDREQQVYAHDHPGQRVPTDSYHAHGMAVDINRDPEVQNWITQNGSKYGVGFTLSGTPGEDNHLEPTENGQRIPHNQINTWISQNQPHQPPSNQTASLQPGAGRPGTPGAGYLAIGDSLGLGVGRVLGNANYTHGGWNPQAVNGLVQQAIQDGKVQGQHIILSGGASNAGGNTKLVDQYYPQMIDALKKAGAADVTVMGVGPYSHFDKYGYNDQIKGITAASGANFTGPLANVTHFSGTDYNGGIHPNDYKPIVSYVQQNFGQPQQPQNMAQAQPPKPVAPPNQQAAAVPPAQQPPIDVPNLMNGPKETVTSQPPAPTPQTAQVVPPPHPEDEQPTPQTAGALPRLGKGQVALSENRRRTMIGLLRPYRD